MTEWSFIKMHGCGNDYVFIDCRNGLIPEDPGELARTVSHRRTSVGADGLVLILPSAASTDDVMLRMFNADGSESSMCGNALRCVALWLFQTCQVSEVCQLKMGGRSVAARILKSASQNRSGLVQINLGAPEPAQMQGTVGRCCGDTGSVCRWVKIPAEDPGTPGYEAVAVSVGNPHTVLFVRDVNETDAEGAGKWIERHPIFPDRTNVDFVQITGPNAARVRVWERGCGETQACGSGACATTIAGISAGFFSRAEPVEIQMPGGLLLVTWNADNTVELTGPAQESFQGRLNL